MDVHMYVIIALFLARFRQFPYYIRIHDIRVLL